MAALVGRRDSAARLPRSFICWRLIKSTARVVLRTWRATIIDVKIFAPSNKSQPDLPHDLSHLMREACFAMQIAIRKGKSQFHSPARH